MNLEEAASLDEQVKCWEGDSAASPASSHLEQGTGCCWVTGAGTGPGPGPGEGQHVNNTVLSVVQASPSTFHTSLQVHTSSLLLAFHTHPCRPASGTLVMSPPWALAVPPPADAAVFLEVRELQQLLTGQTEGRVHHQARLLTQRSRDPELDHEP